MAEHTEPVPHQRHLLLLLSHGAVHERTGNADRVTEGKESVLNKLLSQELCESVSARKAQIPIDVF